MRADPLRSNVDELFVFHVMGMLQIYLHDSTLQSTCQTIAMILELILLHKWSFLGLCWHPWILIPIPCPPSVSSRFSWAKYSNFFTMENQKFSHLLANLQSIKGTCFNKCWTTMWIFDCYSWKSSQERKKLYK